MGRPKKDIKVKEPIHIRQRKLANGNISLYLDIYIKGTRRYESLNLFLVPNTAVDAKKRNEHTMLIAEKVKSERILALQERGVKNWDKIKRSTMPLLDYLKYYEQDSFGFSKKTLAGRKDMRKKVEEYLKQERIEYISMNEVDSDFCRGFLQFLATARHAVATKQKGRTISKGCAHHHQAVLNGALNKAVREGVLLSNPMKSLERREKFQPSQVEREYLTIDELRKLMATPCSNDEVKKAFVFSCFAGFRLSDVRSLTWKKIHMASDGKTQYVHTIMEKTDKPVNVPLSSEALKCLRVTDNRNDPIFHLPTSDATINYHIQKWVKAAGIDKHISFHCSRHTFGTMMLTLGADLYTTSKLMGHTNIQTTEIYAKIVDKKKIEAVNLVDNIFDSDNTNQSKEDI